MNQQPRSLIIATHKAMRNLTCQTVYNIERSAVTVPWQIAEVEQMISMRAYLAYEEMTWNDARSMERAA
jgi:hypothetical protein